MLVSFLSAVVALGLVKIFLLRYSLELDESKIRSSGFVAFMIADGFTYDPTLCSENQISANSAAIVTNI